LFDQQFRYSEKQLERVDARYPDGLAIQLKQRDTNLESSQGGFLPTEKSAMVAFNG